MNTFKITCPHCQQHIECDSQHAGLKINCPSCQGEMVVPAPTAGSGPGVRISSSQSAAPRHSPTPRDAAPRQPRTRNTRMIIVASAVGVVLLLGLIFVLSRSSTREPEDTRDAELQAGEPVQTDRTGWTMDLDAAKIPASPASGSISGSRFQVQGASLMIADDGPMLSLRSGVNEPYGEILIHLPPPKEGNSLEGQTWTQAAQDPAGDLQVVKRWEADGSLHQKKFTGQFALTLELGEETNGGVPGKLFLSLPDEEMSVVRGEFQAVVGAASQTTSARPRPRAPPAATARGTGATPPREAPKRGPPAVILKQRARELAGERDQ